MKTSTLSLRWFSPRLRRQVEFILERTEDGWNIHEIDGDVVRSDNEASAIQDVVEAHGLAAPKQIDRVFFRMWCELDPSETPSSEVQMGCQNALGQLVEWIEATSKAVPHHEYFGGIVE